MSKEKLTIDDIGYIEAIRQRLGREPDCTEMDEEILQMTPIERVCYIAGWYHGYGQENVSQWKSYFESQGIYLTTNGDDPNIIGDDWKYWK